MKRELDDVKSVIRRIFGTLARLEGKLDDVVERMATKDEVASLESRMNQRFDGFAQRFDEFRLQSAVHADALLKHEKRLARLEAARQTTR